MALARLPVGMLRDDPDIASWFTTAYTEATAVGRAAGIALPADAVERTLAFNRIAGPSHSLDGGRSFARQSPRAALAVGQVVELGKKHGVPTPTHGLMYAMLKPYIMGKPA
jgi:2-dehydropantoate 2-reductase